MARIHFNWIPDPVYTLDSAGVYAARSLISWWFFSEGTSDAIRSELKRCGLEKKYELSLIWEEEKEEETR